MLFSRKRIWIAGSNGQLGTAICQRIPFEEYDLLKTDLDVDITDLKAVTNYADIQRPDVLINCAGFTDMQACETDMVSAYKVNTLGARNLASASRKIGAKIISISSDDVFSGTETRALTEFDLPTPFTVYGKSKLAGENMIKELNPKHLIIRSSWVYGTTSTSYVERIIKSAKEGNTIKVPNDQISSPTSASILADFLVTLLESTEYGIYHASCEGSCTRYEFAKTILEFAELDPNLIEPSFTESLGTSQIRYTLLRNLMMELTGIYSMPKWKDALLEHMKKRRNE